MTFRGGIIAAGHGERLRSGGWMGSKAMLPVAGLPLIDHALDRFATNGLEQVSVLINESSVDCRNHIAARRPPPSIHLIIRTTPSSFASFALLAGWLAGARAVITTVDALMPAAEFARFLVAAAQLPPDAIGLGLTRQVDDEAPLWAEMDPADGRIRRLGGAPAAHVTAGLYALPAQMPALAGEEFPRLRDYLARLVDEGHKVYGIDLHQVLDVDRPHDLVQAERAVSSWSVLGGDL
ncbi:MAG: putative Nucleotidyl transferase [Alphaproteobacteria bacterium]|nr:putative Nucleotidyl transferase [Alphaproteobacteria bacterium]